MKPDEFYQMLSDNLAKLQTVDERLEMAALLISRAFSLKPEEVAFFSFHAQEETITFLWPPKLKTAGAVPLSAVNSLVVKTTLENRGFINNSFATTPHAAIFELIHTHKTDEKPLPIQKILSVPMDGHGETKGVIQVSRKGENMASAGKDFTPIELTVLHRAGEIIAGYL